MKNLNYLIFKTFIITQMTMIVAWIQLLKQVRTH